jgi:hypothetical protein
MNSFPGEGCRGIITLSRIIVINIFMIISIISIINIVMIIMIIHPRYPSNVGRQQVAEDGAQVEGEEASHLR